MENDSSSGASDPDRQERQQRFAEFVRPQKHLHKLTIQGCRASGSQRGFFEAALRCGTGGSRSCKLKRAVSGPRIVLVFEVLLHLPL